MWPSQCNFDLPAKHPHLQVWCEPGVNPMVIVKTELCQQDLSIKPEPQLSQPTARYHVPAEVLIDLTGNTEDHHQDMIITEQFRNETKASPSADECHVTNKDILDKGREELKEDLRSEKSNEIVEKSRREEISEKKNNSSKKIEKKSMKKKIENLRLVRKEGFFTINPNKNKLKTFTRTKSKPNKNVHSR